MRYEQCMKGQLEEVSVNLDLTSTNSEEILRIGSM